MKKITLAILLACLTSSVYAQKYMTRTGQISFFSHTPLENIDAINNEVSAVMDGSTGAIVFQAPVKSFKFERALMEEHFNENYMESDKYPRSEFKGKISDPKSVNFGKDGSYKVTVTGTLTMHGVSKEISTGGTIIVKGKEATAQARFKIVPGDYNIRIPSVVKDKIDKEITISVNSIFQQQ